MPKAQNADSVGYPVTFKQARAVLVASPTGTTFAAVNAKLESVDAKARQEMLSDMMARAEFGRFKAIMGWEPRPESVKYWRQALRMKQDFAAETARNRLLATIARAQQKLEKLPTLSEKMSEEKDLTYRE